VNPSPVSLHVWRVPPTRLPAVLRRMAVDRGRLRRTPEVRFAKLLGTGRVRRFGPAQVDLTRWAALVVWHGHGDLDTTPVGRAWRDLSSSACRLDLTPLASRGSWAGDDPFTAVVRPGRPPDDGAVLALTRARLRPTRAISFWRAIGDVAAATAQAPGLLATFGVGEAPIGWQGTVSVWRRAQDLVEFAYRQPDHRRAIDQTAARRWYAEELFARFAVVGMTGDRSIIGWAEDQEGKAP
jgi:hypothetical protein